MGMTKKGLKMNISKCLKNYGIEKSEEVTTKIRGKHDFTKGYRFFDVNYENEYIMLFWEDDDLNKEEKAKIIKNIYDILDRHGFSEYTKISENSIEIILQGYRE